MATDASVLFKGPPRYAAETPWGVVSAAAATVLLSFSPAVLVFAAIAVLTAGGEAGPETGRLTEALTSLATPEGVALAAATQVASLALLWLFAGRQGQRNAVLRLTGEHFTPGLYALGTLVLLVATGLLEVLLYKIVQIDIFADTKWLREGLNSPWAWGTAIIAVVLAPLWEELTFRGFLLSALAKSPLGFWGGAAVANALWTALHGTYSWPGLVSVFVAGLVLSWLVSRTGSIKPAIFAHAAGNMIALAFTFYFAPVAA